MRFVLLVLALLAFAAPASAQSVTHWGPASLNEGSVSRASEDVEISLYGDAAFYAGSQDYGLLLGSADLLAFDPSFGVLVRIADLIGFQFHLPLAFGHVDPSRSDLSSYLGAGNPYLWVGYAGNVEISTTLRMRIRAGVAFALPAAELDRQNLTTAFVSGLVYAGAAATHGAWDAFLYVPDSWTFSVPASMELRIGEMGYVAADFAFSHTSIDESEDITAMQLAVEGGVQPLEWLRLTARLSGVGELDDQFDNDDDFQLAIEPRVIVGSGAFFGSFGLLLNLDEPAGVLGSGDDLVPGIYAFRLLFGVRT